MSFDGLDDACWLPDAPVSKEKEWRVRVAQFGDGYQQRMLDGINALNVKWNVTFSNRQKAVLIEMDNYLSSMKGSAFNFMDPATEVVYEVFCDQWMVSIDVIRKRDPVTWNSVMYGTLAAEFILANGVTIGPIV
jgi:phage-related protein